MKKIKTYIFLLISICSSCIEPNEIKIIGNSEWVVYGFLGQEEAPIIFVYGTHVIESYITYNYEAKINITDLNTGQTFLLRPAINEFDALSGTSEFPFYEDKLGNLVYYTSNVFKAEKFGRYKIDIDLGEEKGIAEITMPEIRHFSDASIETNSNNVSRVNMSINDLEGQDYYKWEIGIDQIFEFLFPEVDSITGDTLSETFVQELKYRFSPNRFINEEIISEEENVFKFNLNANLTDYPDYEETYHLNVRLRHYGKEVVAYFESINAQNEGSFDDPFIEPVFIKSNIDGIIGMIGSYSYSESIWLDYQP